MKIGTLTFHRACNLGGALQCYALLHYLNCNGYTAEAVDYRSHAIESVYRLINTKNFIGFLRSLRYLRKKYYLNKNFRIFRERFIPISSQKYLEVEDLANEYDILLIGSDQVWSKRINHGFDKFYWGAIPGKQRIISYAASMGTDHHYTDEENKLIASYLNNFDAISVREDSLNEEMSRLTNKAITTTIDPTLLLSVDDYREIAEFPNVKDYVLYYQMEYNPESKKRVTEVAKELGCEVVVLGGKMEDYVVSSTYLPIAKVSPQAFIGYILNAKCVFASSFHGVALSVAMKKDFYFLANYETDRADNLLRHIGAYDRRIASDQSILFSKVDYSIVEPKLNIFRESSINFLKENIFVNEKELV